MTTTQPHLTLNNGVEMPALGLGVFQADPEVTADAVETALRSGYRLVDTAAAYFNEREVGEGLRASGVPREDVFLESKIWINDYGYDATRHAFDKATGKLGVESLDLLLLHQPLAEDVERTLEAYRALEFLLEEGRVRAIGVSNFVPEFLERVLAERDVVPAVNQIECHPFFRQPELLELHARHGITTQAWSPIGGITFYQDAEGEKRSTLDDPTIARIAEAHGKTPAQVMLRWHIDEGRQVIPKSVHAERIAENLDVFDFELTADERAEIDGLETGERGGPDPRTVSLETFGQEIPEA